MEKDRKYEERTLYELHAARTTRVARPRIRSEFPCLLQIDQQTAIRGANKCRAPLNLHEVRRVRVFP